MMFTMISPSSSGTGNVPPPNTSNSEAPKAGENTVPLEDALKGGEHTKMTGFTVTDHSRQPGGPGAPGSSVQLGALVQGKIVVELIDSLLPAIIVILFRKLKLDAKKSQFQLTQGEKNTLSPVVEACLNSINLDFSNPWTTLGVCMLIMYGGKALEVGGVQWVDKKAGVEPEKEKKETKTSNPLTNSGAGAAKPPTPNPPKAATDTAPFTNINPAQPSGDIISWGEPELKIVMVKGRMNREKAEKYLNKNWIKNGCQLPQKWLI